MPMRREDYSPDWNQISRRIRHQRAGGCCERCGVQNGQIIKRLPTRDDPGAYRIATDEEIEQFRMLRALKYDYWKALQRLELTRIILTVAHLDRNRTNNDDDNLAALCQRCHLTYDLPQHIRNRKFGRYHDREHQLTIF